MKEKGKKKNFLKLGLSGFTKENYIGLNISGHRQFCPQADQTMCSWLNIVNIIRTKSTKVVNKALKSAYLNHFPV